MKKTLFFSLLILSISAKSQQLNADFFSDVQQGCSPLVVQFTDNSKGNPTAWFWDLGNGNTSTSKNPGAIYFNPGTYTVKLVVMNATGSDSVIKAAFITVSNKPAVNFSADKTIGCRPLTVQFNDASSAGTGSIAQWDWEFGDGTGSGLPSPSHTYTATGSYNVTLKVTNSAGCVSVVTKTSYITVKESPKADFSSGSTSTCSPPVTVNFTSTSTGANITGYQWTFGDGSTASTANPSHSFAAAGTYNVRLIVNNQIGCTDTVVKPIVVGSVSPFFIAPDSACQGAAVNFVNNSAPATVSSFWNFGDGSTSTAINPVKVFNTPGRYVVKLVNNFGGCTDSVTKAITILQKPTASFTFSAPPPGCSVPVNVTFSSTSSGATRFLWNFGDGTVSSQPNLQHTYTTSGHYSVSLVVTNAFGCSDTVVKQNLVMIKPISITGFNNVPYIGCTPFTDTFNASIVSPEAISQYFWNFGDGSTSTLANPTHTFNTTGSYTVMLTVRTASGCADTFSLTDAVKVGTKPAANFTATPLNSCANIPIQFTNTTTGRANEWYWTFGDSTFSGLENPEHKFADSGYFNVTLVVGNNGCYDTITKTNLVYIKPPVAYFVVRGNCDSPYVKRFVNRSVAAHSSFWSFGDGSTSTAVNPLHTYATPGRYTVKLRVTNPPCFDETTDTVLVIDEHPVIEPASAIVCKKTATKIRVVNIDPANITIYRWTFGDNSAPVVTTVPQVNKVYSSSGVFTITLTIKDKNGCTRTVTKNDAVTVFGPVAAFTSPAGGCVNSPVPFTAQGTAAPGYPIVANVMYYGDGTRDSSASPVFSHSYNEAGSYPLGLIVIDTYGCRDTLIKPIPILITNPKANFAVIDTIVCAGAPVRFSNTSSGSNLLYTWRFGDGTVANNANPVHAYNLEGRYSVSLSVKDKFGCTDSVSKSNVVQVGNPKAAFTVSDSVLSCPPAQVNFSNTSSLATSVRWNFGDSSFSTVNNPVHYYLTAGTYTVKLVATGYGTCSDSITKTLVVKGPRGAIIYNTTSHCAPYTVSFTGSSSNNTGNYTWDFGDGTILSTTAHTVSHIYVTIGRYLPKLLLRDSTVNCTVAVFGSDTITVSGANAFIKAPIQTVFCDSAQIHFVDSSVVLYDSIRTYLWDFGDGTSSSLKSPTHTFKSTGVYNVQLMVKTVGNCADTSQPVVIKVAGRPTASISSDSAACLNIPVSFRATLTAHDTSGITYQWSFGDGATATDKDPAHAFHSTGLYSVRLVTTNSSACSFLAEKTIQVFQPPVIDIRPDTTICLGTAVTLATCGADLYSWQPHPTLNCTTCAGPLATPVDSVTRYYVVGKNEHGCISRDSITITTISPQIIRVGQGGVICQGKSIQLSASGTDAYNWYPAASLNNNTISSPLARPDTTTTYTVIGSDYKGCFNDTASVKVVVYPIPEFEIITGAVTTNVGTAVTLSTRGSKDITKYQWAPAAGLSCVDCPQPLATPTQSTTYTATASNAGGCTATDKVTVNIMCNTGNVFIPNTFTPNGDGMNDVFYPRGKGIMIIKNFVIFNRWGNVVFQKNNVQANDPGNGWDGTINGRPVDADAFVYRLEIVCGNGESFLYKGDVTLMK